MGRKTHESILAITGKILPNRMNIVVTRQVTYRVPLAASVVNTFDEALDEAEKWKAQTESKNSQYEKEIFVIGGAEIYALALPRANRFYLTDVNTVVSVGENTYFPLWKKTPIEWCDSIQPQECFRDRTHKFSYVFRVLERKQNE